MKAQHKIEQHRSKNLPKAAWLLALAFALTLVCSAAKADTVATYNVSGTLSSGGTLSGSFTYDYVGAGQDDPVTAVDITVDGVNFTGCPSASGTCNVYDGLYGVDDGFTVSAPGGFLEIIWSGVDLSNPPSTLSLVSTTLCLDCGTNGYQAPWGDYYDNLVSGSATIPQTDSVGVDTIANTPENGTLATLLTGMLALAFFAAWRARQVKLAAQLA